MSPISSSRFLRREERPLGYAANHLYLTPPQVAIDGPANSTTMHPPRATANRTAGIGPPRQRPLVSWRDREGEAESPRCRCAACARGARARSRPLAGGLRRCSPARCFATAAAGAPPGRARTVDAATGWRSLHASFPRGSRSRGRRSWCCRCATPASSTVPNVAVTVDSFNYISQLSPNWPPPSARCGSIEQGPGAIAQAARGEPGSQPARRGQTAYVNTWALGPLAPGHDADLQLAWSCPVKPGTPRRALRGRGRPRAARPRPRSPRAAPAQGRFTVQHRRRRRRRPTWTRRTGKVVRVASTPMVP